jgi:hypothetical protein
MGSVKAKSRLLANLKDFNVKNAGTRTLEQISGARTSETARGLAGRTRGGRPTGKPETQAGHPVGRFAAPAALRKRINAELKRRAVSTVKAKAKK